MLVNPGQEERGEGSKKDWDTLFCYRDMDGSDYLAAQTVINILLYYVYYIY
jgi:hypothetical protein